MTWSTPAVAGSGVRMLECLVEDRLWIARQPLKFGPLGLRTTMTVVRLSDGSLWVHSPIAPAPALQAALRALGPVRHVVAPNRSHHLFLREFLQCFPEAHAQLAPGLHAKRPDLAALPELTPVAADAWAPDLHGIFVAGLPVLNETAWFHGPSGTLVLADLLFRFSAANPALTRGVARLLGVHERLAMSRTMKAMVKDRAAFTRSVDALLALPVRRIVVAHDTVVEADAATQLARAFAWLHA